MTERSALILVTLHYGMAWGTKRLGAHPIGSSAASSALLDLLESTTLHFTTFARSSNPEHKTKFCQICIDYLRELQFQLWPQKFQSQI